jgi:hypothetical protein
MAQYKCKAAELPVRHKRMYLFNMPKQHAAAIGIPYARFRRLIDKTKPVVPFAQARQEYLLIATYLRCSVLDLFEVVPQEGGGDGHV